MEGKYLVGFLGLHQVLLVWAGGRVGGWEGGGEKGLVCNYGPSPRAAGEAVLGKQSHITGCFNPLLPSRLTNCIFLELFAFKIKTLCVKIRYNQIMEQKGEKMVVDKKSLCNQKI